MLIAVMSLTLSNLLAKVCLSHTSVEFTILARFLVPLICMCCLLPFIKFDRSIDKKYLLSQMVRASAIVGAHYFLFVSIQNLSLAEAILLYNTSTIFIFLFDYIYEKTSNALSFIGILISFFGICFMLRVHHGTWNIYVIYGLLSGICVSVSQIILHKSSQRHSNFVTMFFIYLFATILSAVMAAIHFHTTVSFYKSIPPYIVIALILVGAGSILNQFFRFKAYKLVHNTTTLAPLMYISIVFAALIDYVFYDSIPRWSSVLGGMLIILGILVIRIFHMTGLLQSKARTR